MLDTLPDSGEEGNDTGEMVLFAAGRTNNQETTRSATRADGSGGTNTYTETPGETYYMDHASRFVCRMYYVADNTSETRFDLSENTKTISWFVVDGSAGNSLYWNRDYEDVVLSPADKSDVSKYDSFGNDAKATFFYWQNRKNHAFLAWTDLNKAKNENFKYGTKQGDLKLEPADEEYEERTNQKLVQSVLSGFKIAGENQLYDNIDDDFVTYVKDHYSTIKELDAQKSGLAAVSASQAYNPNRINSYNKPVNCVRYSYFEGVRHDEVYVPEKEKIDDNLLSYYRGPVLLWIWGEGQEQEYAIQSGDVEDSEPTADGDFWVRNAKGEKVALKKKTGEDEYKYLATFASGKFHYDFTQEPQYCVAINKFYEVKESEVINTFEVNKFDLTRGTKTSINDQPDPCQALTIMKPMGATQAANRVHLKFKHQFSQVQVNLKASSDNSVTMTADQIQKVELLGVSEEGYVFNELSMKTENNKEVFYVHPAAYKDVDVSKIDESILATNQHGTSLELFDMGEENYAAGYLKSFNAITFGLLKAIRITWIEKDTGQDIPHVATFKVTDTNLSTLRSGRKYIWNIELRRGTLAVITTTIDDWIVPTDKAANGVDNLNYGTDGTISN